MKWFYDYFHFRAHKADLRHEISAGFTIYFSMVYVVFTIPMTLIHAFPGAYDGVGVPILESFVSGVPVAALLSSLAFATCITAGVSTIFLAFYARLPLALAPSLGLSLFFTYYLCLELGYTYYQALAAIFISGILFFILNICGWRQKLLHAIPDNLKYAISAGLGLFLAFAGLQKAKIIIPKEYTLIGLNNLSNLSDPYVRGALLTIVIVIFTAILIKYKIPAAILIGKVLCIIAAIPLGLITSVDTISYSGNLSLAPLFMQMDFEGLFASSFSSVGAFFNQFILVIITITLVDVFESIGTLIGSGHKIDILNEEKHPKRLRRAMMTDSLATIGGAITGVPPISVYAESSAGIAENGKTGVTALVAGILFLLTSFAAPYVSLIPACAAASTMIVVGAFMLDAFSHMTFDDITETIPSFFIIIMSPLTNSIATGIGFGIISYTLIRLFTGHAKEIHPLLYALTVLFASRFLFLNW